MKRRTFVRSAMALGLSGLGMDWLNACTANKPVFRISLAQWSHNRAFRGGQLDNLDFAKIAKNEEDR